MRPRRTVSALASALTACAAVTACTGVIGDRPAPQPVGVAPPGAPAAPMLAASSRVPRLSHAQWENTVRDLFYLDQPTGLAAGFTSDPLSGTFDNNGEALVVASGLWGDYQRAAEQLAARIAGDPALLARIIPVGAPTEPAARARAFVAHFVARAYRRPLTDAELASHLALFNRGPELVPEREAFAAGAQLLLELVLQSPHFIYRVELSDAPHGEAVPRSGYEIAARLSYALWNTMPDDALSAAAGAGALDTADGVTREARRLLADPRAVTMVQSFHDQLLRTDHFRDVRRDPARFPNFTPTLAASMLGESRAFVREVVFADRGGFARLMTAPYTLLNRELAPLYGLDPSAFATDGFHRTELDGTQRAGWLTHAGFLAANATDSDPDAIHRGVFVNLQLLCANLPPPPNNVPPLPAPVPGETNRQRVTRHTGAGTCGASCHGTMINPVGFAFEHYDPLGQWRTMDRGQAIDARGSYHLDGAAVSYDGAVAFTSVLARSEQAHECYVRHWLEYTFARPPTPADASLVAHLGGASRAMDTAVQDLVVALVASDAFRARPLQGGP